MGHSTNPYASLVRYFYASWMQLACMNSEGLRNINFPTAEASVRLISTKHLFLFSFTILSLLMCGKSAALYMYLFSENIISILVMNFVLIICQCRNKIKKIEMEDIGLLK